MKGLLLQQILSKSPFFIFSLFALNQTFFKDAQGNPLHHSGTVVPVMNGHPRDQAKVSVHVAGGRSSEGQMGTLK